MVCWGRLAGDIWDNVLAAPVAKQSVNEENAAVLNTRIKHWTEVVLPTIPLLPSDQPPDVRQLRQHVVVHTLLDQLRLLLWRRTLLSLKYDSEIGRLCGDLAIDVIQRIRAHSPEAKHPSSFRFHMAVSLGGPLLTLSTLLVRDLAPLGLQDRQPIYGEGFREAFSILHDLSTYPHIARRILDDFKDIAPVVSDILNQQQQGQAFSHHVVPPNVAELLPYREIDFAQQSGCAVPDMILVNGVDMMVPQNVDPWEYDFTSREGGYGVPWI